MNESGKLLTADDLASRWGVSKATIFRRRCYEPDSLPPAVKVGSHVRWREQDVDAWLSERVGK